MTSPLGQRSWWVRRRAALLAAVFVLLGIIFVASVRRPRHERETLAAIDRAGGRVIRNWSWLPDHPSRGHPAAPWLTWPPDPPGADHLGTVVSVDLSTLFRKGAKADDALLASITRLDQLRELDLCGNVGVTDAGLWGLRDLKELRKLNLSGTGIRGSGLVNLKGMTRLKELHLDSLPISDDELAYLAGLSTLESLFLRSGRQRITDDGLRHLEALTNLERLFLSGMDPDYGSSSEEPSKPSGKDQSVACFVTSAGLVHLRGMNQLQWLSLAYTRVQSLEPIEKLTSIVNLNLTGSPITDSGLLPIKGFSNLGGLGLSETSVGDAALIHLVGLAHLGELDLSGTRITNEGLVSLSKLPELASLNLDRTSITDAGLTQLAGLSELRLLSLDGTRVTAAGLACLGRSTKRIYISAKGINITAGELTVLQTKWPKMTIEHESNSPTSGQHQRLP